MNTAINGSVDYDSLRINWNGDIILTDVVIRDTEGGHLVGTAPEIAVGVKLSSLPGLISGNRSGGADAISSVSVERPDLHIWQLADGSWSVTKLIKPSDPNEQKSFEGGDINVDEGTVALRMQDGTRHVVNNLNGSVALDTNSLSKGGAFTGSLDGSAVQINGSVDMNDFTNFEFYAQSDSVDVSGLMNFVPLGNDISVKKGTLQDLHVNVKCEDGKYIMSGNVKFKGGLEGTYKRGNTIYTITDGNGRIMLNHNQIVIAQSSWRVNDQVAKVNGLITLGGDNEEYLNLNVVADKVDVATLTDSGITGTVGGRAHIGGTTVSPYVSATVASSGLSYGDYHVDRAQGDIVYDNGRVKVSDITLFAGTGSAKVNGQYMIDDGSFTADIKAHALPLDAFTQNMNHPIGGIC